MLSNSRQSIIHWNNRFPLDRWWRKKYNISFLSEEHRKSTFFGHYFEYVEDEIFKEYFEKQKKEEENGELNIPKYQPMKGNWWKGTPLSKREADDWFNSPIQ